MKPSHVRRLFLFRITLGWLLLAIALTAVCIPLGDHLHFPAISAIPALFLICSIATVVVARVFTRAKVRVFTRRFRFSLGTMFILVTVLGVLLGLWVREAERQKEVVAWVQDMDGVVSYDYQIDKQGIFQTVRPPGPKWLRELIGVDYFAKVCRVTLVDPEIDGSTQIGQLVSIVYVYQNLDPAQPNRAHFKTILREGGAPAWLHFGPVSARQEPRSLGSEMFSNEDVVKLWKALPDCEIVRLTVKPANRPE